MSKQTNTVLNFTTEAQERVFWEKNDSADYQDWKKAKRIVLPNLKPTTKTISLRLPQHLLDSIKTQSLIKVWLQEKLHGH